MTDLLSSPDEHVRACPCTPTGTSTSPTTNATLDKDQCSTPSIPYLTVSPMPLYSPPSSPGPSTCGAPAVTTSSIQSPKPKEEPLTAVDKALMCLPFVVGSKQPIKQEEDEETIDLSFDTTMSASAPEEDASTSSFHRITSADNASCPATQMAESDSLSRLRNTPPGLVLSVPPNTGRPFQSHQVFLVPSGVQRTRVNAFPKTDTFLEEGMVMLSPGCQECRSMGIYCTFGAGVLLSGKPREPSKGNCDFCKLGNKKCRGNGFTGRKWRRLISGQQTGSIEPPREAQGASSRAGSDSNTALLEQAAGRLEARSQARRREGTSRQTPNANIQAGSDQKFASVDQLAMLHRLAELESEMQTLKAQLGHTQPGS